MSIQAHQGFLQVDEDLYRHALYIEYKTARWKGQAGEHVDVWYTDGTLWFHHALLGTAWAVRVVAPGGVTSIMVRPKSDLYQLLETLFAGDIPWAWLSQFGLYTLRAV